jgi:hypothetical protein
MNILVHSWLTLNWYFFVSLFGFENVVGGGGCFFNDKAMGMIYLCLQY